MNFIFRDENWIVVEKKSGQLSVPSRFQSTDPRDVLGLQLQKQVGKQIFPVHRLDFEVSGITLWALTPEAHKIGQSWFEHKNITKKYKAISGLQDFSHWPADLKKESKPILPQDRNVYRWECRLLRGKKRSFESERGLVCLTEAQILEQRSESLIWDLSPITGRSHQLRFEMSRHGFPIKGDKLYGSKVIINHSQTIALKAYRLDLKKIASNDRMGLPEFLEINSELKEFE